MKYEIEQIVLMPSLFQQKSKTNMLKLGRRIDYFLCHNPNTETATASAARGPAIRHFIRVPVRHSRINRFKGTAAL